MSNATRPPAIRAVFLDIGGTLLEMGDLEAAYRDILHRHDHPATPEQVKAWLAQAREEFRRAPNPIGTDFTVSADLAEARRATMARAFLRAAGVAKHLEACVLAMQRSWVGLTVFRLYPDTVPVLAQLKAAGLIVGAVSNWEPRLAELCANHGIAEYFDFILASEAEGHAKPGTRLFALALERAGVDPAEAIHVGDSLREDVDTAESLGIRGVLIERDPEKRTQHSPRIRSLEALLPLATASTWLRGRVESGKGEAAGFTEIDWVRAQVSERLGFVSYPGTLNLRLEEHRDLTAWGWLRQQQGVPIEPSPGFCAARCFRLTVEGKIAGAIILPLVADYPTDVVEVLAPLPLRDALGLCDGLAVTLAVV